MRAERGRRLPRGIWALLLLVPAAWAVVLLLPGRTAVSVTASPSGLVGSVNGASLELSLPKGETPGIGQTSTYIGAAPDLGPPARWERQRTDDKALSAELVGEAATAGLMVRLDASGNGYAFVLQPGHRNTSWWHVSAGVPTAQIAGSFYRPSVWPLLSEAARQAALALTAALALLLLTQALALLWSVVTGQWSVVGGQPRFFAALRMTVGKHSAIRNPQSAILFALAGTLATAWVCLGPLQGIPHVQDDVAYLWQAKVFALGHAWVPTPPQPRFFEQGFILITDGRWFAKYPPGWPLMLVPGVLAGIPWLINPLCAGASLGLIYATGRRIYGAAAGFWAAALGLLSPFLLFMSGSFMSHPATMLAVAAALYCFERSVVSGQWSVVSHQPSALRTTHYALRTDPQLKTRFWPFATGFCLGWAFISREATAVGIAIPFIIWALLDLISTLRRPTPDPQSALRRLQSALRTPYSAILLGALPPLLVLGAVNWAQLGSPFEVAQTLVGTYDRLGFGPGFGPEPEGHTPTLGLYNALVYWRSLGDQMLGWPAALTFGPLVLALLGPRAGGASLRRRRWDLLLLGGFLGLVAVYFAWWSATTIYGPRYWYEALPFLLLLSGWGIQLLGRRAAALVFVRGGGARAARAAGVAVPALVVGLLILYDLTQVMPGQVQAYTGYNDVTASSLQRVEAAHLDNALVFVALQPEYPRRDYGKVFFANDPLLRGPVVYVRDLGPGPNRRLLPSFPGRSPYYLPLDGPPKPGVGP
ncbi:MAG: hypothetical protein ACR2M0_11250 [Chloroflexia bacterium]